MANDAERVRGGRIMGEMGGAEQATFLNSILESSTEYSIIAKGLDGTLLAWSEGARRIPIVAVTADLMPEKQG